MQTRSGGHLTSSARFARAACVLAVVIALVPHVRAQATTSLTEDQVKAAFLFNFTKYTDWPAPADHNPGEVHICIVDGGGVGDELSKTVEGKLSHNRVIRIREIDGLAELRGCEVLFAGRASSKPSKGLFAAAISLSVLTVSDGDALAAGAMVQFVREGNRVRFDINLVEANKARIAFDSRLVALARARIEESR